MRHLAITFLAATAFTVGCKPAAEQSPSETQSATAQFDKVKNQTNVATHGVEARLRQNSPESAKGEMD